MAYRSEEATLRARLEALEHENAALRAEVARLSGAVPLPGPAPAAVDLGGGIWSPGSSWLLGWIPKEQRVAYVGEARDERPCLRFFDLSRARRADHALAPDGAAHTARFGDGIVAPLADGSLARFRWPETERVQRIHLSAPLVAQPISRGRHVFAVTRERELLVIERDGFIVVERRPVDAPELSALGFPDGDPRQRHNGWELDELELEGGWRVVAYREEGQDRLCAFARSFAGVDQLAAGVAPRGSRKLSWLREVGTEDFIYLYAIDGLLVLHNVSLREPPRAWALDADTGAPVLTVVGRAPDAVLEVLDDAGAVAVRATI